MNAEELWLLIRVTIAMLLGGLVGLERESADKPAGLRTHMLVAGAAALFVGLGNLLVQHASVEIGGARLQTDPVRIIEAVVTGISFLGAGTIIRSSGEQVHGLTTAASLLVVAGIGIAVATSRYTVAVGSALLVLLVLYVVGRVEDRAKRN
jgi:putative Mg2+ transporter-C (MgtC) family protein